MRARRCSSCSVSKSADLAGTLALDAINWTSRNRPDAASGADVDFELVLLGVDLRDHLEEDRRQLVPGLLEPVRRCREAQRGDEPALLKDGRGGAADSLGELFVVVGIAALPYPLELAIELGPVADRVARTP